MLKKGELEILSALDEPSTISMLAETLDRSESYISRLVSTLSEKELVETHREGRRKIVEPGGYEAVRLYRDLVQQYPHIDFPALLQGKAIPILYYLDEPITVSELAEKTDNYRNTVHRIVKRFQERGIIRKNAGTYVLNDDFQKLNRFARALVTHLHIIDTPISGTILWETVDEFLLQTDAEIDDEAFLLTGPRRFTEFDIPLVTTDRRHYFYSERVAELSVSDLVCHMLLIDDSARYKGYCLLLITKEAVDEQYLRERAEHYELTETIDELLDYLRTHGETTPSDIVSWNEFEQMAAEYGVDV